MNPEVKEYKESNKEKNNEHERDDQRLNTELDKKDGNNILDAMDLMAQNEIKVTMDRLSPDELKRPEYIDKFTKAQKDFEDETKSILSVGWTPEEKTEKLEAAFKNFQDHIGTVKGTKEAQDAQRWQKQAENMQAENKNNTQWNQNFKEALLGKIKEQQVKKEEQQRKESQKQWAEARKWWDKESKISQWEAMEKIKETYAV